MPDIYISHPKGVLDIYCIIHWLECMVQVTAGEETAECGEDDLLLHGCPYCRGVGPTCP
jgi:hypothetical protein